MFLSNPRKSFGLFLLSAITFQACGSPQANQNTGILLAAESTSEFPFSTREPEIYQAKVVITVEGVEQRYFIARKAERWRLDVCGFDWRIYQWQCSDGALW